MGDCRIGYCVVTYCNGRRHCASLLASELQEAVVFFDTILSECDDFSPNVKKALFATGGQPANDLVYNWKGASRYARKDSAQTFCDSVHPALIICRYFLKAYPTKADQVALVSSSYLALCWALGYFFFGKTQETVFAIFCAPQPRCASSKALNKSRR